MLFAWDDEVWKVFIQSGFGFLGTAFAVYLTYKINSIAKKQLENSSKIDMAADKAQIAALKATVASEKLEKIDKQTNGLMDEIKKAAREEGHQSGEKAALQKLGIDDRRERE